MIDKFLNIFKIPDLRKKLLFTAVIVEDKPATVFTLAISVPTAFTLAIEPATTSISELVSFKSSGIPK